MALITTIKEAKAFLKENWANGGTTCPCCSQPVKLYKKKLNFQMAKVLIDMYKTNKEWVHPIKDLTTINGDYAKLRFWGLLEPKVKEDNNPEVKASGYWRITERGQLFVTKQISIPQTVYLFNNKAYNIPNVCDDEVRITISDALGTKFNYGELMKGFKPYRGPHQLGFFTD